MQAALFLDRDGTLNVDTGYVSKVEDWHWLPGVPEALARISARGIPIVIVSNQSGIARGMYTEADLARLEAWVTRNAAFFGANITAWYHCPHLPSISGPCTCRKPEPGMLLTAAQALTLSLSSSWMIGDRLRDVEAGVRAGTRTIKLGRGDTAEDVQAQISGAHIFPSLAVATDYLLTHI